MYVYITMHWITWSVSVLSLSNISLPCFFILNLDGISLGCSVWFQSHFVVRQVSKLQSSSRQPDYQQLQACFARLWAFNSSQTTNKWIFQSANIDCSRQVIKVGCATYTALSLKTSIIHDIRSHKPIFDTFYPKLQNLRFKVDIKKMLGFKPNTLEALHK